MKNVHRMIVTVFSLTVANMFAFLTPLRAQEATPLEPGKSIEREIVGGQTHIYQITLAAGQFMRVAVDQRGIDIELRLFGPDRQKLIEMDTLNSTQGPEVASVIAEQAGNYRVEIISTNKAVPTGRYEMKVEAVRIATEQDRKWIAAQRAYVEGGQLQTLPAAEAQLQAIQRFEEALRQWQEVGDRLMAVHTLYYIASGQRRLGRHQEAHQYYSQALQLLRAIGDQREEAPTLLSIGITLDELGEPRKALEYYDQALLLWRDLKDSYGEARTLLNLGVACRMLGEIRKALDAYNHALSLWRKLENRLQMADTLTATGAANDVLGQWQKSLEHYNEALTLYRTIKNYRGEATTLNNLGVTYGNLGEVGKELGYYNQALAVWRMMGNIIEEANPLVNIGAVEASLTNPQNAMTHYTQALQLWRETGNRRGEAITLQHIGKIQASSAEPRKALEYFHQALLMLRTAGDRRREALVLHNLGYLQIRLGEPQQAMEYSTQALAIFRSIGDRSGEGQTLSTLMMLWNSFSRPPLAILFGKQAVNACQEIRNNIRSLDRESQQSFLKSQEETYRTLADLLIAQGRLPEAEQVIRMLKEEEYFEYIRRDEANAPKAEKAALTPEEAALDKRYREIADKLTEIGTERSSLLDKKTRTPADEQRLAKLETDLVVAGQAFQKFLVGLAAEMGKNADTNARAFQLRESQGLMEDLRELGKGVVALYTLVGEDKYRVILTTADFQKGYEYPIKAAELNRKVLAFRDVLQNPKLDPLPLAQELYKILVGPVAKDLQSAKAQMVMWSLDGVLRYLPVAALHDGKQYLVERYRTAVFTPASQSRLRVEPSRKWTALGLGVTKAHGLTIPALPGVLEEMHGIIKTDGANSGVLPGSIKLDEAFTQEAMLSELRKRNPVVHIASHFRFQPGNETNSALLLGDGQFLSLAQIKSLPNVFAGVDLLTLSACNTATGGSGANGKEVEGFGVLAQRQGAKAVVASLWPVADRSTKNLMQEFYKLREAKADVMKVEALRQAQIKLLRGELLVTGEALAARSIVHEEDKTANLPKFKVDPKAPYAHPYYWALFILIGNWK